MFNYNLQPVGTQVQAFQRAKDKSHTLPLSPPNSKGGSETQLRCFTNKTIILYIKLCYALVCS